MDTKFKAYLAGQLRSFRRQAGMTQAELAEAIGRTDEAISNIERGKSTPNLETLIFIAGELKLPLRDFFPSSTFDSDISVNRMGKEAEVMALVRGLSDAQLVVALAQIKALSDFKTKT